MTAVLRQFLSTILTLSLVVPASAVASYPVGNRTQKTTMLVGYPGGLSPPSAPVLAPPRLAV
jgi:hypothetical protein